jgi:hypothetical protein
MANERGVYWVGADGNYYVKATGLPGGVINLGQDPSQNQIAVDLINSLTQIPDPVQPESQVTPTGTGGGTGKSASEIAAEAKIAQDNADRAALKGEISGKTQTVEDVYAGLFSDLNTLVTARDAELETQYGDQFKKAGEQYADAIPQIETSYAAIGAADSTDNTYAKVGAKKGFEDTTETIGKNKTADKAKLGAYKTENEAKFTADRDATRTNISRAGATNDVDALRGLRNDIETNVSGAKVTKATLGTDGTARQTLSDLTKDGGRFEATINALDSVLKSSLSGDVKSAAVKAISENSGLSDEEKKKVDEQYGNVYAEQQAL